MPHVLKKSDAGKSGANPGKVAGDKSTAKMKILQIFGLVFLIIGLSLFLIWQRKSKDSSRAILTATPTATTSPTPNEKKLSLAEPIFKTRITKKPFGIYITPETSPVQPERFRGYHTGADVEYEDIEAEVPVFALSDGEVVFARTVSGYGGVAVMSFRWQDLNYLALYGHLRPSSLPEVGREVTRGEQIGVLGRGGTAETDGERKHLHFAILKDAEVDLRGYVSSQAALGSWLDPLTFY